jgi:Uma2 family endonuclease
MGTRTAAAPTLYRFTRDEYYRMAEAGLFENKRVELLDGEIITMSPHNTLHAATVYQAAHAIEQAIGNTTCVRCQLSIVLNSRTEPEPDIAVCRPVPDSYKQKHPTPDQVLLVIEVAESSLRYDRTRKTRAYAAARIPEYWIVNLVDRQIEVLIDPDAASRNYQQKPIVTPNEALTLPGGSSILSSAILP